MDKTKVLCSISDLTVIYQGSEKAALEHINLTITKGSRLSVIGESGSGKSTLARALASLLPETAKLSGAINWQLPNGRHQPIGGKDIGYVFQDPSAALNPVMKIGKQIGEAAAYHLKLSQSATREHVLSLLEQLELSDPSSIYHAYPHQLSGGQKQRVAIGAAISANPQLLICDEATSALDNQSQSAIVQLINALVKQRGMTLIAITHDLAVASQLSEQIAVMHEGKIVEQGATKAVLQRPQAPYAKALIAANIDLNTPIFSREAMI